MTRERQPEAEEPEVALPSGGGAAGETQARKWPMSEDREVTLWPDWGAPARVCKKMNQLSLREPCPHVRKGETKHTLTLQHKGLGKGQSPPGARQFYFTRLTSEGGLWGERAGPCVPWSLSFGRSVITATLSPPDFSAQ